MRVASVDRRAAGAVALAGALAAALSGTTDQAAAVEPTRSVTARAAALLPPGETAWLDSERGAVRGVTIGPIESALHPDAGYGTARYERALAETRRMGGNWIALTIFGRVWDLASSGIDPTFEAPVAANRRAVAAAVAQAHAQGLRVMLVPHLWVETGGWRALIDPGSPEAWTRWAAAYGSFVRSWAVVAHDTRVDLFSVGVELRSWVTTAHAPSFVDLVRDVRRVYPGLVTYAGNWDDVESTVVLGELDVIGINAFYPLAEQDGADLPTLVAGGERVRERVRTLAESWHKPVLFTEFGYTTRPNPAIKPWEWPDDLRGVTVDQEAQAEAYYALLAPLVDEPWFAGFFVWRMYADPDDVSQEAEWGFSPRGKLAELVLRDAFAQHWAADGPRPPAAALLHAPAWGIAHY